MSDAEFAAALGVEFGTARAGVRVAELNDLFERVGFARRDPERLRAALDATHRMVWVRAARTTHAARAGQLLGFARATSDGALTATVWDVAVAPAWQRGGLGRALMERLTRGLVADGLRVALYAEPGVVGLYRRLGFVPEAELVQQQQQQRQQAQQAQTQAQAQQQQPDAPPPSAPASAAGADAGERRLAAAAS